MAGNYAKHRVLDFIRYMERGWRITWLIKLKVRQVDSLQLVYENTLTS